MTTEFVTTAHFSYKGEQVFSPDYVQLIGPNVYGFFGKECEFTLTCRVSVKPLVHFARTTVAEEFHIELDEDKLRNLSDEDGQGLNKVLATLGGCGYHTDWYKSQETGVQNIRRMASMAPDKCIGSGSCKQ
jgi:hypothetical protein